MRNRFVGLALLVSSALLFGCASTATTTKSAPSDYHKDLITKVSKYNNYAFKKLKPYFDKAGVHYAPKQIALLAFKNTKRVELWARDSKSVPWRHIKDYPILAASGTVGPKLHDHDYQVPEGIYKIVALNPDSRFHLSMELNYPNAFDKQHAKFDGRTNLGDQIFMHGSNRSIGCIALGNPAIEEVFVLAYMVGMKNIEVVIAPDDLRKSKPIYGKNHPWWLNQLYSEIKQELSHFKA